MGPPRERRKRAPLGARECVSVLGVKSSCTSNLTLTNLYLFPPCSEFAYTWGVSKPEWTLGVNIFDYMASLSNNTDKCERKRHVLSYYGCQNVKNKQNFSLVKQPRINITQYC